jgi:hypothetical protein
MEILERQPPNGRLTRRHSTTPLHVDVVNRRLPRPVHVNLRRKPALGPVRSPARVGDLDDITFKYRGVEVEESSVSLHVRPHFGCLFRIGALVADDLDDLLMERHPAQESTRGWSALGLRWSRHTSHFASRARQLPAPRVIDCVCNQPVLQRQRLPALAELFDLR